MYMRIAIRKPVTSVFSMDRFRCFVLQGFGVVSFIPIPDQVAEVEATIPCGYTVIGRYRPMRQHAGMMPAEQELQDTRFWMMTAELSISD
jgi:hypothetical protein